MKVFLGSFEAAMLRNCNGERPSDLAYKGQFMNIYDVLSTIEVSKISSSVELNNKNYILEYATKVWQTFL